MVVAVSGINSKSLEVPINYASNIANETALNTCDVSAFPDYYMTSLEYAGVYHVIIPDSQPFIIDSTGNSCTANTIDAESNLSSAIETFENYMIFHYNGNTIRMAEYNTSGVTTIFTETLNASMVNDSITCGYVMDEFNRCYFLDSENVLHYLDFTDISNISITNFTGFNRTRNTDNNPHIRTPLLTNFESNNPQDLNQLVFLDDVDGNAEDGIRIISLDDYSSYGFGYVDNLAPDHNLFGGGNKQHFLTNPIGYSTTDGETFSYGINKLYYGSMNGSNPSAIDISLNSIDVSSGVITSRASTPSGATGYRELTPPYDSRMSELFILRNQTNGWVCSSILSSKNIGSEKHIILLCYNPTTTETYNGNNFYSMPSHNYIPYNQKIFPVGIAYNIEINKEWWLDGSSFWVFGDLNPVTLTRGCSPYYDYGLQEETCTYPPPSTLLGFNYGAYNEASAFHYPTYFPIAYGNIFGAMFSQSAYEGNDNTTLSVIPTGINTAHDNRFSLFEDLNADGLADYVYTYSSSVTRFVYSTYENLAIYFGMITINSASTKLCINNTYTFSVIYADYENDEHQYRYKCTAGSSYSNWTTEAFPSGEIDIECTPQSAGVTRFYVDLKRVSETSASFTHSIEYTIVDGDGSNSECSLSNSGTITPSGISVGDNIDSSTTPSTTLGLDELAESQGWSAKEKNLIIIVAFIGLMCAGLFASYSKRDDKLSGMGASVTMLMGIGLIYFFYSIEWVSGFFLTLIGFVSVALIIYALFINKGD